MKSNAARAKGELPFEISRSGDMTIITLPPRRNRPFVRAYGLLIAAASVGGPLAGLIFFRTVVFHIITHFWHILFALFSALSYGVGLFLTGHVTITLGRDSLVSQRRAGPFVSRSTIPPHSIARLELDTPSVLQRPVLPNNTSLNAELADGGRIPLAQGYPRELLLALAEELSARMQAALPRRTSAFENANPSPLSIIDVSAIPTVARDVLTQPAKSLIRHVEVDGLQTYTAKGFGKTRPIGEQIGFMVVCLVLTAGLILLSVLLFKDAHHRRGIPIVVPILVLIVAALFMVLLLRSVLVFLRRCVLIIAPESLTRITRGPLHKTENHWRREDIAQIRTFSATENRSFHMTISKTDDVVLRITTRSGQKFTLLSGSQLDMRWLATRLRSHLDLPNC